MEPDVSKLQELVEWAEAEEAKVEGRQWDQGVWVRLGDMLDMKLHHATEERICNSSYCIAGKVIIDAGCRVFTTIFDGEASFIKTPDGERHIEHMAAELLGIDRSKLYAHPVTGLEYHGEELFSAFLDARGVRVRAEAIAGKEL